MIMKDIHANSPEDLLQKLSNLNIRVPARTKGRKTPHTELWTISRFLSTYATMDRLSYPLDILHRDKPDFQINMPSRKIGIEITESIPEQYAYVFALREQYFPNANIEPSMFTRDAPKRNKKELLEILENSQHKLTGLYIAGYKIEMDWAEWISEDIMLKTNKLNSISFEKFESNFLLIYDNLPHVANDIHVQLKCLEPKIEKYWNTDDAVNHIFENIFIVCGEQMIELNKRFQKIKSIVNAWD